jgi:hypothetical protein
MFLVQGIHRWVVYVFSLAYTHVTAVSLTPRDVTHTSVSNVQKVVNRPAFIYFHFGGGGGGGVKVVSVLHMAHLLVSIYLCACMRAGL